MMKLCCKCGIVELKQVFIMETLIKNIEVNVYSVVVLNRINGDKKNCEKIKNHIKQYYEDNTEKIRNQQKKYYDENRDVIIKNQINYERNRSETDVNFRLIRNTRRRIHHALNGKLKSS